MTWMLTWLNVSAAALNATFQLLVIYRLYILVVSLIVIIYLFGLNVRFSSQLTKYFAFGIRKQTNNNSKVAPSGVAKADCNALMTPKPKWLKRYR